MSQFYLAAALQFGPPPGDNQLQKFSMTAYDGGLLRLPNFEYPVVVDLTGMQAAKQVKALVNHDGTLPVGHMDRVEITDQIHTEGLLSVPENAPRVVQAQRNGFQWDASIGAIIVDNAKEFIAAGKKVSVNGRDFTGPLIVARKTILDEVSFVGSGAGRNTSAQVAAVAIPITAKDLDPMPEATEHTQQDTEQLNAALARVEQLESSLTTERDELKAAREEFQSETARLRNERLSAAVDRISAAYGDPSEDLLKELRTKASTGAITEDQIELQIVRASRGQRKLGNFLPAGGGTEDLPDGQVIEAALLLSTGHEEKFVGKHYDEKTINAAMGKKYRGWTLHALMGAVIHASGGHFVGSYKSNEFIRAAKKADHEIQAAGFSSLSVTNVLENVANKSLIASYEAQETVWQYFCAVKNYTDFKVQSRYRLDASGSFKKVGADGELKQVSLTDAKFTNQLDTYGALIALSRQMMINDDLDAFLDIPRFLGQMSAVRIEEAFFVLLLSNPSSFFSTDNKNLMSGGSSALAIDSLTTGEQKFRDQVTPNGKPLLISPQRLLVPTTLKVTADNLFAEKLLVGTGDSVVPNRNPHVGKYTPYTSPYLNNTAITDQDGNALSGQSDTHWYLFADPNVRAAVVMGFLNGQQRPTIESEQTPFETLGMQWRGFHDFGCGMEDPNASVRSAGA